MITRNDIFTKLRDTYVKFFGEEPEMFDNGTRIYADLKTHEPLGKLVLWIGYI